MIYILRVSNNFVVFSKNKYANFTWELFHLLISCPLLFSVVYFAIVFINLSKLKLIKTTRSFDSRVTDMELFICHQL